LRRIAKDQGSKGDVTDMLCSTATQVALDNNVDLFIVLTETGKIARYLAKQRPMQTILACSPGQQVVRQINTSRGVIGYKIPTSIKSH
jgi:pyruvate kinase